MATRLAARMGYRLDIASCLLAPAWNRRPPAFTARHPPRTALSADIRQGGPG
jgi:hypothetical protein